MYGDTLYTMKVHHELFLYLDGYRDNYWISEGDEIHVYAEKDGYIYYQVDNHEYVGTFPTYFLDPTNSYSKWLENNL